MSADLPRCWPQGKAFPVQHVGLEREAAQVRGHITPGSRRYYRPQTTESSSEDNPEDVADGCERPFPEPGLPDATYNSRVANLKLANSYGITSILRPGGSVNDLRLTLSGAG